MEEKCCVIPQKKILDQAYWDSQYKDKTTGWDIGHVSPPMQAYIDSLTDKDLEILIPGCGNTYEAEYLLQQGFHHVTVIDIAPTLVEKLQLKFTGNPNIHIVLGDFFTHAGQYDLILEQTFFCALPPLMRPRYVAKMHELLKVDGSLAGVLFNRSFVDGPPFGGNQQEYEALFNNVFHPISMQPCDHSIAPRANSELVFKCRKNNQVVVQLYSFRGIIGNGCMTTVTNKFKDIDGVLNVHMNATYSEVMIVSASVPDLQKLQDAIAYDGNYHIEKMM